jgi:ribosomal protein L11 methyltransferase
MRNDSNQAVPMFPRVAIDVGADDTDLVVGELFELGAVGVEERDQSTLERSAGAGRVTMLASFSSDEDAQGAMAVLQQRFTVRRDDVVGDEWRDAWKDGFKPFRLTDTIVVRPPWETAGGIAAPHVLTLEPGRAFGTGLHATTMLVARALERHAAALAGIELLDVGCGTGILGLVALLHGASAVRAIDNDPDVVGVVEENAAANTMRDRVVVDTTDVNTLDGAYPVVVANIEARVLTRMAGALRDRVAPGGLLVLSGVLDEQKDDVIRAYSSMALERVTSQDEWVAIELRKSR